MGHAYSWKSETELYFMTKCMQARHPVLWNFSGYIETKLNTIAEPRFEP